MVGQAVGAHGCAPFVEDRQDAGPTQDARRHQILLLFAITFENPCMKPLIAPDTTIRWTYISVGVV
jgi:hypothetical protein